MGDLGVSAESPDLVEEEEEMSVERENALETVLDVEEVLLRELGETESGPDLRKEDAGLTEGVRDFLFPGEGVEGRGLAQGWVGCDRLPQLGAPVVDSLAAGKEHCEAVGGEVGAGEFVGDVGGVHL